MAWHCGASGCPTHSSPEHQCRDWRLAPIRSSVGNGGTNGADDVRIIQGALNRLVGPAAPPVRLDTDGRASATLSSAIERLQDVGLGHRQPDGRVDVNGRTYKALARTLRFKRILVNLSEQMLEALEDGRRVYRFECVTGDEDHPTDAGRFEILRKSRDHRSRTYDVDMHYALFFTRDGKAIHQYHGALGLSLVRAARQTVSDWFGSHGCVRLTEEDARALFEWSPLRTQVFVY